MSEKEVEAIKKVIEKAYMEGIYRTLDRETVESGFHKDFRMLVLRDNEIRKVSIDQWLEGMEASKAKDPEIWSSRVCRHVFHLVDVAGRAAVTKLDVYINDEFKYTDYMLLYKFEDGWKIVSKIFTT